MKYLISILVLFNIAISTNSAHANHLIYDCTIDNEMICGGNDSGFGSTGGDNGSGQDPSEGDGPETPQ